MTAPDPDHDFLDRLFGPGGLGVPLAIVFGTLVILGALWLKLGSEGSDFQRLGRVEEVTAELRAEVDYLTSAIRILHSSHPARTKLEAGFDRLLGLEAQLTEALELDPR